MNRERLALTAGAILTLASAHAEPFKCPHTGGNFIFAQAANFATLDPMAAGTISTRNIAMNIYESLMTRDENNHPILELAAAMHEAPDRLTYTFALRQGVHFHNGRPLTSADVVASFDRYAKLGVRRSTLENVDRWDAPDALTFAIHLKTVQPTFIDALSSPDVPIAIMPAGSGDPSAQQPNQPIGTGPYRFVSGLQGDEVKLERFADYLPNSNFQERTGFGGYKQACFDTITFRIVTDPDARAAGLRSGAYQGVEDLTAKAAGDLKQDADIVLLPVRNWWIQLAVPNVSNPPTDRLPIRKAIQAALDMQEIMDAASDGTYRLNAGFQYPGEPDYLDAGKQTYNLHNPDLARRYLAEAGYQGEPVVLLTNTDYPSMYNAALVVQQQLQAVGIDAVMKVVGWPASAEMVRNTAEGWNLDFTAWGTQPALGARATMQLLVRPNAAYKPMAGQDDPDLRSAWNDMNMLPTPEGRKDAFARMQALVLDRVYAIPFGVMDTVQAVRSNVNGFVPFRIPRMANVWFSP